LFYFYFLFYFLFFFFFSLGASGEVFLGEFARTRVAVKRILKNQQGSNRPGAGNRQAIRPPLGGKAVEKITTTPTSPPSLQVAPVPSPNTTSQTSMVIPFLDQMMMGGIHLVGGIKPGAVDGQGNNISPSLAREVSLLLSLHHPHIIRLYGVAETASFIAIVMEYAGCIFYFILFFF
jgi:serine/threonine protein kinase